MGTNFALRRYPNSQGVMDASVKDSPNGVPITYQHYHRMEVLLENEYWYYGGRWIPYGLYHDFMDDTNNAPNNPVETWDRIQGVSIQQLYNAHGSNITNMLLYRCNFRNQTSSFLNTRDLDDIFDAHQVKPCN